jgi:hypothetical protein
MNLIKPLIVDGFICMVDLIVLLLQQRLEFLLYGFDIFLNLVLSWKALIYGCIALQFALPSTD